jgi:hypothetical protein
MSMKHLVVVFALLALAVIPAVAGDVDEEIDDYIELLKADLATESREIIAEVMHFTDVESKLFWPIYDEYLEALEPLADRRLAIIRELAESWPQIPDRRAGEMGRNALDIEEELVALQRKYFNKISEKLNATTAAKWLQLDNRIRMLLRLQVAAELPIIP